MPSLLFLKFDILGLFWSCGSHPEDDFKVRTDKEGLVSTLDTIDSIVSWNVSDQLYEIFGTNSDLRLVNIIQPLEAAPEGYEVSDIIKSYFSLDTKIIGANCNYSNEQWDIINSISCGYNVLCQAVAGSGKTTALLVCALRAPNKLHLLITYSKKLQMEVEKKVASLRISNVIVMTYHAVAGKSYECVVSNDTIMRECVKNPPSNPIKFDVMLLDETQDMTVEYLILTRYLFQGNPSAQIVVVGDELQCINEYRGANPGFLIEAATLYKSSRKWVSSRLSISYRMTPANAEFINTHLYRAPVLIAGNNRSENKKPLYITGVKYWGKDQTKDKYCMKIASVIFMAIKKYGYENIFILANSTKMTNRLSLAILVKYFIKDVPLYISNSDEEKVDETLLKNKLAILTFNASKGLERECVFLLDFDELYFYNKQWNDSKHIPNILTVAATRVITQLIICGQVNKTLRTIDMSKLNMMTITPMNIEPPKIEKKDSEPANMISVTDLVSHLHPKTLVSAMSYIVITKLVDKLPRACCDLKCRVDFDVAVDGKTTDKKITEDFAYVYGILAPIKAEIKKTGTSSFNTEYIIYTKFLKGGRSKINEIDRADYNSIPLLFRNQVESARSTDFKERTNTDWIILIIFREAIERGRYHIPRQVTNYEWVNNEAILDTQTIVSDIIDDIKGSFEIPLKKEFSQNKRALMLHGRADFIAVDGTIWEFKLGSLTEENMLQLGCYIAMRGGGEGILISILKKERISLYISPHNADAFLNTLFEGTPNEYQSVFELVDNYQYNIPETEYDQEFDQEFDQENDESSVYSVLSIY